MANMSQNTDFKVSLHLQVVQELNKLYEKKNKDYGDSFSKARKDIPCYTIGKLYDKLQRIINITKSGQQNVSDETVEDTLLDLANYAIMEVVERLIEKEVKNGNE